MRALLGLALAAMAQAADVRLPAGPQAAPTGTRAAPAAPPALPLAAPGLTAAPLGASAASAVPAPVVSAAAGAVAAPAVAVAAKPSASAAAAPAVAAGAEPSAAVAAAPAGGEAASAAAETLFSRAVRRSVPELSARRAVDLLEAVLSPKDVALLYYGIDGNAVLNHRGIRPNGRGINYSPQATRARLGDIVPLLMPHLRQTARLSGRSPKQLLAEARAGTLDEETLARLRAPVLQSNGQSGNAQKHEVPAGVLAGVIGEQLARAAAEGRPRRLKVLLGGTLSMEIGVVTQDIEQELRAQARRQRVADVEAWIDAWDVQVVAYSISGEYMRQTRRDIQRQLSPRRLAWVRQEYIDLLDDVQMRRFDAEKPDLVLTVDSLYLRSLGQEDYYGSWLTGEEAERERAKNAGRRRAKLAYVERVRSLLPRGGAFFIEVHSGGLQFDGFTKASSRDRFYWVETGAYVKGGAFDRPFSLLGGVKNTPHERRLYEAWTYYREGRADRAARTVRETLLDYARAPGRRGPPRFSIDTALMLLGPAKDRTSLELRRRLTVLKAGVEAGREPDLAAALAGL
jgi:hypothetical protein